MQTSMFVAEIKMLPIFTCHTCGKKEAGTTARVEFRGTDVLELRQHIDSLPLRASDMPVGWASYGDRFDCGCKRG